MAETSLARMFWNRVEKSALRPAQQLKQHNGWTTLTWREVGEIARELATGLLALGRKKEDAVAILSASRAEWVQADFAIFSVGGVTIPIYPSYPPDLIQYIVNDACCALGVPLVEGSVAALTGQVMSVVPGRTACYRCAFPEPPDEDASADSHKAGVLGAVAGIVGAAQALEAIKLLTGVGTPLVDRILRIDGWTMQRAMFETDRQPGCPSCSRVPAAAQSG